MKNSAWSTRRVTVSVLFLLCLAIALFGLYWVISGVILMYHHPTNGEDPSGFIGSFFTAAGASMLVIGGLLALLFSSMYRRITHQLKDLSSDTPDVDAL
jgi:uncharacterized protein YjeT (DUF2065 family)